MVIWGSQFTAGSNYSWAASYESRRKNQVYTAENLTALRFGIYARNNSVAVMSATCWIMGASDGVEVLRREIVIPANSGDGYFYSDFINAPLPDGDYYIAVARGGDSSGTTALSTIRASSVGAYTQSTGTGVVTPWETGSANDYDYPVFLELEESVDPSPSFVPEQTDVDITVGATHNVAFQNLASPPISIAIVNGETVTAQSDFVYTPDAEDETKGTATFTGTLGNLPYGTSDYSYLVVCEDDSEITLNIDSLSPAEGRDYVVAVDPVNDETGILYVWDEGGSVTGDQISWPVLVDGVTTTIRPNFTFYGETETTFPDSITLDIDYWDSVTGTRYYRSVEVAFAEDGEGTVIGISRAMTARKMTAVKMTARKMGN